MPTLLFFVLYGLSAGGGTVYILLTNPTFIRSPWIIGDVYIYCVCTADQKDDRLLTANSVPRVSQGHSDQA